LGITAVTQPNINAGVIERLRLPVPDLEEQDRAIRNIETAFAWIDRLASQTTRARKLVDHLDQAILAKAFRGELVPQDPNDEPASVLLARIKAERCSVKRSTIKTKKLRG
jgi:type I restriction enzyme S subunit